MVLTFGTASCCCVCTLPLRWATVLLGCPTFWSYRDRVLATVCGRFVLHVDGGIGIHRNHESARARIDTCVTFCSRESEFCSGTPRVHRALLQPFRARDRKLNRLKSLSLKWPMWCACRRPLPAHLHPQRPRPLPSKLLRHRQHPLTTRHPQYASLGRVSALPSRRGRHHHRRPQHLRA